MRKHLRIITGIVILLVAISFIAIEYEIKNILAYSAIRPSRISKEQIQKKYGNYITPAAIGLDYSECNITVEDTIKLKGWFIPSRHKQRKGTIFILHGIGSCKNALLPFAKILSQEGFNTVLYDSRANGESGGLNCTFGYYEKRDLSRYIDSVSIRFPDSQPYAVYGNSLGAAVSIQSLAVDKRLVCGIAESPFADLRNIVRDYFARMFLLRINYIPDRALKYTELIAHFQVDNVRPVVSAKYISQPTMIIHGLSDEYISSSYGKMVFNNLSSKEKIWYPIENGNHYNLAKIGDAYYRNKIIAFYNKYLIK